MTVGQRIKERRKEIGMSAEQVAAELGVSPSTIYRYENGEIEKMGIDKLEPVAKTLRTTVAVLMGWDEPSETNAKTNNTSTHDIQLTGKGERASDDDIKFALFGGDGEITDEMYEEVKKFAQFIKQKEREKGNGKSV